MVPASADSASAAQAGADLGDEFVENKDPQGGAPAVVTTSIEASRETTRAWLAGGLTALLATVVLLITAGLIFWDLPSQDAQDMLSLLLAPLVGLVAAATGFYYGQKK